MSLVLCGASLIKALPGGGRKWENGDGFRCFTFRAHQSGWEKASRVPAVNSFMSYDMILLLAFNAITSSDLLFYGLEG